MLTKIGLENFKSWQHLDIDLAPITILFGTNSSGKTSILQALLLLKQTVNSFDRKQHINFGGGERDYVDFGSYQDLVYGHDEKKEIGVRLSWNQNVPKSNYDSQYHTLFTKVNSGNIGYQLKWKKHLTDTLIESITINLHGNAFVDAPNEIMLVSPLNSDVVNYTIKLPADWHVIEPDNEVLYLRNISQLPFFQIGYFEGQHPLPTKEFVGSRAGLFFEDLMLKMQYLGPIRQFPERYYLWTESVPGVIDPDGNHTIQTLIASENQNNDILQKVEEWLIKLGLVDDLKLSTPNDRFYEPKIVIEDMESALVDVGFGVSQVLPVITMLLSAPEGSIILLEQPELHLHPNAQMVLADLMLYVAEKRNLQLIVESHSEHLLRRLQRRIAEVEQVFANPDNIKMYFCEPGKNGSTIKPVEVDEYGQIGNWPPNFFGDISGDLEAMTTAALNRRRQELSGD